MLEYQLCLGTVLCCLVCSQFPNDFAYLKPNGDIISMSDCNVGSRFPQCLFLRIIFCSVFKVSHQCSSVHQVKKQLRPMRLVLLLVALQLLTIWGRRITGLFWSTCLFKQHDAESKPNILAFALIRSHEEKSTSQTSRRASYRVTTAFSNQVTLRLSCIVILLCFSHYSQVKAIYLQSTFVNNKSWRKCFAERWRYRIIWLMITIKRKHKICERKANVN